MASSCSWDMPPIMFSIMDSMPGLFFIMSFIICVCATQQATYISRGTGGI